MADRDEHLHPQAMATTTLDEGILDLAHAPFITYSLLASAGPRLVLQAQAGIRKSPSRPQRHPPGHSHE
jgi:hypothetical protein